MLKFYDQIYNAAVEAYRKERFTVEQISGGSQRVGDAQQPRPAPGVIKVSALNQGFSILCRFDEYGELFLTAWSQSILHVNQHGPGKLHLPSGSKTPKRPANFHVDRDPQSSGPALVPILIAGLALNMLTFDNVPLDGVTLARRLNDFTVALHRGYPVKDALITTLQNNPKMSRGEMLVLVNDNLKKHPQPQETQESITMTNPIEAAVFNERNTTDAYSLNSRKAALLMMTGYTTCLVCYDLQPLERMTTPPKLFTFLAPLELSLAKGDILVVPAKEGQFDLARVVHVDDIPQLNLDRADTYKWVVSKVEFGAYNELVKRDEEIARAVAQAEHTRMREQLKASLGDLIGPEALTAVKAALNIPEEAKEPDGQV